MANSSGVIGTPAALGNPTVIAGVGVTHLRYRYAGRRSSRRGRHDSPAFIDESGEDYLFARKQFALVDFPQHVRRKILALERVS